MKKPAKFQTTISINHQETAQIPASGFLNPQWRNQPNSRLRFLSASFYVPELPCTHDSGPAVPLVKTLFDVCGLACILGLGLFKFKQDSLICRVAPHAMVPSHQGRHCANSFFHIYFSFFGGENPTNHWTVTRWMVNINVIIVPKKLSQTVARQFSSIMRNSYPLGPRNSSCGPTKGASGLSWLNPVFPPKFR